jgi:light-regulated signal transduction histidine kinase (bacteriophytochrome)
VPYLGLRYPATDIPSQARELYKKNLLRTIANVTSISSAVLSKQPGVHLDLTYSILRSVSPYHLEYLQNMGVAATLTASLIVNGKLWGLIACHHTTPYLPSTMQRSAIGELAQRLGHWLEEREKEEQLLLEKARTTDAALLLHLLASTPAEQIWRRLFFGRERLASLLHADACALVAGQEVVAVGPCPSVEWLRVLAKSVLKEQGTHPAVFWEEIPDLTPLLPEQSWPSSTCGMAARVLLRSPQPVVIFAFRSELMHEIYWGGDPSRPVEIDERQRLSPRRSFELWRETIRGKSKPWSYQDRLRLEELGRMLSDLLSVPGNLDHLESSLASLANQDDFLSSEGLQLADSAAQGMALLAGGQIDKQDVVLSANARFCETFALDSLHIQGFTVDKMLEGLSATLLEDDSERSVWEIWSPQQGHRVLSLQRKNFVTYEGRAGHLHLELFDFLDITNDRRLREAMRVARDQAIHSAEIKSAVLANMSHELRTPLSAILSYSEIMAEEFFGPLEVPQYKKAAQDIHAAGKHLLDLVNNLLDLAKLEGGNTVLRRQKINMVELVEQCAEWILPLSSKSEIKVDTIIQGENFFYYADPVRLKQVLINLLTNAVKFTPPGGNITVLLEERPHMGLVMEVQDSGVGIPADKIRYIFDRFYQVDLSDVRRVQGAGLGLSIARAIVELHGGRIEVESQEGRGTRMRVNLPNLAMAKIDAQGHLIHKSS